MSYPHRPPPSASCLHAPREAAEHSPSRLASLSTWVLGHQAMFCRLAVGALLGQLAGSCAPGGGAAGLATTSAVIVGGALAPLGQGLTDGGRTRRITGTGFYDLGDGRVAIANPGGWFTDRSEVAARAGQGLSAWVITPTTASRDPAGAIVLGPQNLDRWFFREHDRPALKRLRYEGDAPYQTRTGDRVRQDFKRHTFTLLLGDAAYCIALSQEDFPDKAARP